MTPDLSEPKSRITRKTLVGAAVIGLLLAGLFLIFIRPRLRGPDIHFDTLPVQRGKIVAKVTATGTLNALLTVQVGSQVSGRIAQLNADFNSAVTKGQVIAKIDPQLFDAALAQARANYLEAQGTLSKTRVQELDAKRLFERARGLKDRGLVSQAEVDTAEATWLAAKAQVEVSLGALEQTKAARNQAQINLAYTTIVSPINGVVISRNVDVGQTVAASLQAPTLFTIAEDLRKMQVHTNVAEADVGKLAPKMTTTFTVDAYPNDSFRGVIHEIRNAAQTVQNVVTYDAVIDVDNEALKLRPGMTANVTVVYAEKDDALKIPNAALRFKPGPEMLATLGSGPQGPGRRGGGGSRPSGPGGDNPQRVGMKTVWVLKNPHPAPVQIQTGLSDGTVSEAIESPLREGDQVITGSSGGEASKAPPGGGFRRPF
jgi:HlyD family secretion protein